MSAMPIPADLPGQVPPLDVDYAMSRIAFVAAEMDVDASDLAAEVAATAAAAPDSVDEYGGAGRWYITDHQQAEWAMRKLAEAEAELDRIREQAEAWIGQITEWAARERRSPEATAAFMRAHLERYAVDRREHDPAAKTLHLPSGVVRTTQRPERVVVADEDALVKWAQECEVPVLRTTVKPDMGALKDAVIIADWHSGEFWACKECGAMESPGAVKETYSSCGADAVALDPSRAERRAVYTGNSGLLVQGVRVEPPRVTATVVVER